MFPASFERDVSLGCCTIPWLAYLFVVFVVAIIVVLTLNRRRKKELKVVVDAVVLMDAAVVVMPLDRNTLPVRTVEFHGDD